MAGFKLVEQFCQTFIQEKPCQNRRSHSKDTLMQTKATLSTLGRGQFLAKEHNLNIICREALGMLRPSRLRGDDF